jgi:hypothetical protein
MTDMFHVEQCRRWSIPMWETKEIDSFVRERLRSKIGIVGALAQLMTKKQIRELTSLRTMSRDDVARMLGPKAVFICITGEGPVVMHTLPAGQEDEVSRMLAEAAALLKSNVNG